MCLQVCAELRTRLMRNGRISEYRQTLTSSSSFTIPSCDNGRIMVIVIMALKTAKALPTQKGPVFPLVLVGPPKAIRIYPLSIGVRYSINIHKPSIIGGNAREIIPTSDLQMTDRRGEATHPMYQQMHQLFRWLQPNHRIGHERRWVQSSRQAYQDSFQDQPRQGSGRCRTQ